MSEPRPPGRVLDPAISSARHRDERALTGDQGAGQCLRCGRATPYGVSLCDDDNPGGLAAPSAGQVHGTIALGVGAGFVLLAVLARFLVAGVGPFDARVVSQGARSDGGVDVVFEVTNRGSADARATCRIAPVRAPGPVDDLFLTAPLTPGAPTVLVRTLPAVSPVRPRTSSGTTPIEPAELAVSCR